MKFGLFYEHQMPKPWTEGSEHRLFQNALDQIELADQIGIEHLWEVEHHFLEEYSHSSAPEVFLAACSQRTKQIRLGHGINLMPANFNHPARVAERIATLDLVSNGRVEWGTGESGTAVELEGFNVDPEKKMALWQEATEQAANMLTMTPYPGFKGQSFSMPPRNIVPKPFQKPHPPMWMACSRRESIHRAARHGLGALTFAFVDPELAQKWVQEYYDIIKSPECVPLGHSVNANVAIVSGMSCHANEDEALRRGLDGFRFFGFSLGYYAVYGDYRPGRSDVWEKFQETKGSLSDNVGRGGLGTPDQVRRHIKRYEDIGIDQIIFVQQSGANRHEHICESLDLFGRELLPEFKERELAKEEKKRRELEPYIAAALERKSRMPAMKEEDIPTVLPFARRQQQVEIGLSDREIQIPTIRKDAAKQEAVS